MLFKFDHLVHFTKKPELAAQKMVDLGFHAVMGGRHETWGTYNSICHFGLPYIEFLGLETLSIAQNVTRNTLIRQVVDEHNQGEGFFRLALRTDNIEKAAHHFSSLGHHTIGPVEGERRREDGTLLKWAMLFIDEPGSKDPYKYPFIIDWKISDAERAHSLKDVGLISPDFPTKIKEIGIGSKDPRAAMEEWSHLFHLTIPNITCKTPDDEPFNKYTAQIEDITFVFHYSESTITRPTFIRLAPAKLEDKMEIAGSTYFFN